MAESLASLSNVLSLHRFIIARSIPLRSLPSSKPLSPTKKYLPLSLFPSQLTLAWERALEGRPQRYIAPNVVTPSDHSAGSAAGSTAAAEAALEAALLHSQAVTEREQLRERRRGGFRRNGGEAIGSFSRPMFHITQSLDPGMVAQQACEARGVDLNEEEVDALVSSWKEEMNNEVNNGVNDGVNNEMNNEMNDEMNGEMNNEMNNEVNNEMNENGEEKVWTFIDAQGFEKGPYPNSTMRAWMEQGFLTPTLMLRYRNGPWKPLRFYFADVVDAFLDAPESEKERRMPRTVKQILRKKESERAAKETGETGETPRSYPVPPSQLTHTAVEETPDETPSHSFNETPSHSFDETPSHSFNETPSISSPAALRCPPSGVSSSPVVSTSSRKGSRVVLPLELNYSHSERPRATHIHESIEVSPVSPFSLDGSVQRDLPPSRALSADLRRSPARRHAPSARAARHRPSPRPRALPGARRALRAPRAAPRIGASPAEAGAAADDLAVDQAAAGRRGGSRGERGVQQSDRVCGGAERGGERAGERVGRAGAAERGVAGEPAGERAEGGGEGEARGEEGEERAVEDGGPCRSRAARAARAARAIRAS